MFCTTARLIVPTTPPGALAIGRQLQAVVGDAPGAGRWNSPSTARAELSANEPPGGSVHSTNRLASSRTLARSSTCEADKSVATVVAATRPMASTADRPVGRSIFSISPRRTMFWRCSEDASRVAVWIMRGRT